MVSNVSDMYTSFLGKFVDGLSIVLLEGSNSVRAEKFVDFWRNIDRTIKGFLGAKEVVFWNGPSGIQIVVLKAFSYAWFDVLDKSHLMVYLCLERTVVSGVPQ